MRGTKRSAAVWSMAAVWSAVAGLLVAGLLRGDVAQAQQSPLAPGTVVLLAGTPHLWIVDDRGALRWVGDTRALSGVLVDWSHLKQRSADQLRQLPRRDPLLSAGLVTLGGDVYVARWDTWQRTPTLLHVRAPGDLSLIGIDQSNYGSLVLEAGQWERQFGMSLDALERGELAPFSPLPVLVVPPFDPAEEGRAWQAALAAEPVLGVGDQRATAFPGQLRLPPRSLPLLEGLHLVGSAGEPARGEAPADYVVILKGPTRQPGGPSVALPLSESSVILQGSAGRRTYDEARARPPGCEGDAGYCATYLRLESDSPDGVEPDGTVVPPVHERFGEMVTAAGHAATVTHAAMGNGEWWEVIWYDAEADVSYSAALYLDVATRIGAPGLAPTNVGYARLLADLTDAFVAVPAS